MSQKSAQRLSASTELSRRRRDWRYPSQSCSTPFGIYGIVTIAREVSRGRSVSAQRLSASTELSHRRHNLHLHRARVVLNAFRHLRNCHLAARSARCSSVHLCSTPFGIYGIVTKSGHSIRPSTRCAQRLSASTELSPASCSEECDTLVCAQRLSASTELSLEQLIVCPVLVKCSTPFGIYGIVTVSAVNSKSSSQMCSTPFGIYGIVTH